MAGNIKGIVVEIGGNTAPLDKALQGVNKTSRDLQSELKQVEKLLKLDPTNTELLAQKQKLLAESIDNTSDKLIKLKDAEKQVQKQFKEGKITEEQYRSLQREIIKTEKDLKGLENQAKDTANEFDFLGTKADKMNSFMKSATLGVVGVAGAAVALTESTREYREDLAKLETNAKTAGAGLDTTKEALKSLNSISSETDSNIEALSNLLEAGFKDNEMQTAIDALSGAVIKFPDTLKIEGLADGLQETLATGKAVGPFSEMLERLGYNLDDFNEGLAQSAIDGQQQQYILDLLANTGLANVTESYKEANEALIGTKNAQFELNDSMAQIGSLVEPVVAELLGVVSELISWILDNKEAVITALAAISAGLLAFNVVTIIQSLIIAIKGWQAATQGMTLAQKLLNLAMSANPIGLIVTIIAGLVAAIIVLWNTNEDFRNSLIGVWENIKNAVASAIDTIVKVFWSVIDFVKNNWQSLLLLLANPLLGAFKLLYDNCEGFRNFINKFVSGIIKFVTEKIPSFIDTLINWFKKLPSAMLDIGKNIVSGIWNGISGMAKWLWDKVTGFVGGIVDGIKKVLKINSPSQVFADEVGTFMAQGIGVGFESEMDSVSNNMAKAIPMKKQNYIDSPNNGTQLTNSMQLVQNISLDGAIFRNKSDIDYLKREFANETKKTLRGAGVKNGTVVFAR